MTREQQVEALVRAAIEETAAENHIAQFGPSDEAKAFLAHKREDRRKAAVPFLPKQGARLPT